MEESLRQVGYRGDIGIIPNGVDVNRFCPSSSVAAKEALRVRLGIPPGAEVVVFVGGYLIHRKGVDLLADAWASIASKRRQAYLLMVGPTHNALKPVDEQNSFLAGVRTSPGSLRCHG